MPNAIAGRESSFKSLGRGRPREYHLVTQSFGPVPAPWSS